MAPNVGPAIRKSFLCQLSHYDWRPTWGLNWEILKFKFVIQFFHWFFFLITWSHILGTYRFKHEISSSALYRRKIFGDCVLERDVFGSPLVPFCAAFFVRPAAIWARNPELVPLSRLPVLSTDQCAVRYVICKKNYFFFQFSEYPVQLSWSIEKGQVRGRSNGY